MTPNPHKGRFGKMSKEELSKINSVSGKKSEGAKRRWFKAKNPEIAALMEFYKSGDEHEVMTKYTNDNETFMQLFDEADNVETKRKLMQNYVSNQFKIFELMFGTKSSQSNVNLNIDVTTDAVMDRLKAFKEEQVVDITGLAVQEKPEGEELEEQPVEVSDEHK